MDSSRCDSRDVADFLGNRNQPGGLAEKSGPGLLEGERQGTDDGGSLPEPGNLEVQLGCTRLAVDAQVIDDLGEDARRLAVRQGQDDACGIEDRRDGADALRRARQVS